MKILRSLSQFFNREPKSALETRKEPSAAHPKVKDALEMLGPDPNDEDGGTTRRFDDLTLPTPFAYPFEEADGFVQNERPPTPKFGIRRNGTTMPVMDAATLPADVANAGYAGNASGYSVPPALQDWYMRQSFIGYQACALIAQHWLIDKACSMPGEDAVRHGWSVNVTSQNGEGNDEQQTERNEDLLDLLTEADQQMNAKQHASEFNRFTNIFGIRVVLFEVSSEDPDYYEKPFNPDGVTEGSYKGIRQIDPYWMMPMMTMQSTGDPTNRHFYDPEFWIISGKRFHRSHLIIGRGPIPADILKPMYIFGGIPLTQRIYERVYAAERTANEAPLLAMSTRTTFIKVNPKSMAANQATLIERIKQWVLYRDNYAVKLMGSDEEAQEFDTSLADLDSVIMTQYQIVAAESRVPATKLLGTSPKGFNATGEFEEKSYHEELESIQENRIAPLINRHHLLALRSAGIKDVKVTVVFNPVDAMTAEKLADINKTKADTDTAYVNLGSISPEEVRTKLKEDPRSGYQHLSDEQANTEMGMSTENLLEQQKAEGQEMKGEAAQTTAGAHAAQAGATPAEAAHEGGQPPVAAPEADTEEPFEHATPQVVPPTVEPGINKQNTAPEAPDKERLIVQALQALANRLDKLDDALLVEGQDIGHDAIPARGRSTSPSVVPSVRGSVSGMGQHVDEMPAYKLPKMKMHGLPLVIENPKGTVRQGTNMNGTTWRTQMQHHYGYIKGVQGADGDDLDAFVGPNLKSQNVFVVNQNDPDTGEFDEHKVMFGFDDADAAQAAYTGAFDKDWKGFGSITPVTLDSFRTWIKGGKVSSPLDERVISEIQSGNQTGVGPVVS